MKIIMLIVIIKNNEMPSNENFCLNIGKGFAISNMMKQKRHNWSKNQSVHDKTLCDLNEILKSYRTYTKMSVHVKESSYIN